MHLKRDNILTASLLAISSALFALSCFVSAVALGAPASPILRCPGPGPGHSVKYVLRGELQLHRASLLGNVERPATIDDVQPFVQAQLRYLSAQGERRKSPRLLKE